ITPREHTQGNTASEKRPCQGTADESMASQLWLIFRIFLLPPATTLRGGSQIITLVLVRL
ncbi:hypothetical protein, partial [uncultured Duncaniella sp.]|uniref:hypothetical protein n=1 Tax=uncultured Duncaniella sp. TaxID=2768039 RepID=UPI00267622D7